MSSINKTQRRILTLATAGLLALAAAATLAAGAAQASSFWSPSGYDLVFVKTKNTGSGKIEVHTALTSGYYYQAGESFATRFAAAEAANGVFQVSANGGDLYFIKTKNTGSGRIEIHTATYASGYQSGIDLPTRFSAADALNGTFSIYQGSLVFIKTKNTGTGKVEVFTASPDYDYMDGITRVSGKFTPADAANGTFSLTYSWQLMFIKTRNTASGKVEALTESSTQPVATRFSTLDAVNGWFGGSPGPEFVTFVKTRSTASGTVEVYYASGWSSTTRFSSADANNGWFGLPA